MIYEEFLVQSLGNSNVLSPLKNKQRAASPVYKFVDDTERILYDASSGYFSRCKETGEFPISFEKAGPKEKVFFEPAKTKNGFPHAIRYIDPSYIIRSAPANANDSKFCNLLAQNAVHAAISGKTDFVVGFWNDHFTLIPIPLVVAKRKRIDVEGELWWNVLEATGQPVSMKNP
jgi:6-phosphofructokinase